MKLRIRGNSLRFRLSQKEVLAVLAGDTVSEAVHFSPLDANLLTYSVQPSKQATCVTARFENGEVRIEIPMRLLDSWGNSDQVGIESTQPIGDGNNLRIAIEKDFRCLQPRSEEDESDNFPNPEQIAVHASSEETNE